MIFFWKCRRTFIATLGLILLFILGFWSGMEVAGSIVTVVMAVAGANATEKILRKTKDDAP